MSLANNYENATTARPRPRDYAIPECDPSEAALIGSVGYDARAIDCGIIPDMFLVPLHRKLWQELTAFLKTENAVGDNGAPDHVHLTEWLKSRGMSKADLKYFVKCVEDVPSAACASGYAGVVREKFARRELIRLGHEISNWAAGETTLDSIYAMAQSRFAALQPIGQSDVLGAVMVYMSEIGARQIDWLWPSRIPLGRLSMLVGRPGEGKSFLTAFMAATVSTGSHWPDGMFCPQGEVILISGEDDPGDTIRPRLDAHGADCSKIYLLKTVVFRDGSGRKQERGFSLADIPQLEAVLTAHPEVRLIVIDPIGSFLGQKVDGHRDNEIRGVLTPLAALAEKHNAAVLIVAHRRKSAAPSADDMALGSIGFVGLSRAVWHLSRDQENPERRLLLPGKTNLCRQPDGLAFTIEGSPPSIVWEPEPVRKSADDQQAEANGFTKHGPEPEARSAAMDWLSKMLANGSKLVAEINAEGEAAGLSRRTINRAADGLNVCREKDFSSSKWRWSLPPT